MEDPVPDIANSAERQGAVGISARLDQAPTWRPPRFSAAVDVPP